MFQDSPMFSTFSVDDLDAARNFYGGTLGLDVKDTPMGILEVLAGKDSRVLIYPKPDHRPATFTVLNFPVPDIGSKVDALTTAGVTMEHYDMPQVKTDDRGIAGGDEYGPKIAWFRDPAGNILSVIEDPTAA